MRLAVSPKAVLLGACVVYAVSTLWIAWNCPPGTDEGWFASPAYNLINHGHMGTSVLDPYGFILRPPLVGIERHTYWVLPMNLVAQAAWYKIFGFGLLQMRLLSLSWGLIVIISLYVIVERLAGDAAMAALASLIGGFDLLLSHFGSLGRMDMMCLGLGMAAQAVYLILRNRKLEWALVSSHLLIALSGLTHPNGIIPLACLVILTLALDRKQLHLSHIFWAGLPYALTGTLYGLYIMQDPAAFRAQVAGNNVQGGRFYYTLHPLAAIRDEFGRFATYYGLLASRNPIGWLKVVVLVVFAGGTIGLAIRGSHRLLLACAAASLIILTFFNFKNEYYLIYAVPYMAACAACFYTAWWREGGWRRWATAAALAALVAIDAGTTARRGIALRNRGVEYAEIVNIVRPLIPEGGTVQTVPIFAFLLGFDRVIEDDTMGYFTGKRWDVMIHQRSTEVEEENYRRLIPDVARHRQRLMTEEYDEIYRGPTCTVYVRKGVRRSRL